MVRETHVALHHHVFILDSFPTVLQGSKGSNHPVIGDYFTITAQPDVFDIYVVLLQL